MTVAVDLDRYDAAVFDLDGVVTDTAAVHAAAWARLFDEYLGDRNDLSAEQTRPFSAEDYRRHVDGKPRYDGVRDFLASRGVELAWGDPSDAGDRETVCGLGNRKDGYFAERLEADGLEVFDTSVALLRAMRDRGMRTALFSASRNTWPVLRRGGLVDLFDAVVGGVEAEEAGLPGKPAPDVPVEAARRVGAAPERCVIVEDAVAGVEAGRAGGFALVVGVDRGGAAADLLEHGADVVVDDLGEIELVGGGGR